MPARTRPWVVGAVALALTSTLTAQRLPLRHYRTADGLPQSQILTFYQDRHHELWLGSWGGASRFDGSTFRNLGLADGLPSNGVFAFAEDDQGRLWAAVTTDAVCLDDAPRGVTTNVTTVFEGPTESWVRDLHRDGSGRLWAAGQRGGIAWLDGDGFVAHEAPPLAADVFQVLTEHDDTLLLGTARGIVEVRDDGQHVLPWPAGERLRDQPITFLESMEDGSLLAGTAERLWRAEDGTWAPLDHRQGTIRYALDAEIDRQGDLWVVGRFGVYRASGGTMTYLDAHHGFPHSRTYGVLEDHEGNLWFGSDRGLHLFPGPLFELFTNDPDDQLRSLWSLAEIAEGDLLAGTDDGLLRFRDGRFARWADADPLRGTTVRALLVDLDGDLWAGTLDHGLFFFHDGRWRNDRAPDLPAQRIYGLLEGIRGEIWLATREGVVRRDTEGRYRLFASADGLPSDHVWQVGLDPEGRLVAATRAGLARLEGDRFVVPEAFEALRGKPIPSFVHRLDGSLWVGTQGHGLYHRSGDDWNIIRARPGGPPSLPADDFAWGLLEDRAGRLWLATNSGLDVLDTEGHWQHISQRDGLIEAEININVAHADREGRAWFGFTGGGGLVAFPPALPSRDTDPVEARILQVSSHGNALRTPPFALTLPWQARDVTYDFHAVAFRDAASLRFRTRLVGYDANFSSPDRAQAVRYTNLPAGRYHFEVQASTDGGAWQAPVATASLTVTGPIWRSPAFLTAAIVLAGLVFWGALALRTRQLERARQHLESEVEAALAQVQTLSGMLPICASCKKVRDDGGYWQQIELYIRARSEAEFSHGLCPDCTEDFFREMDDGPDRSQTPPA